MKKDKINIKRKPRKLMSDDEKLALCKRWKASSLSAAAFCREHGIGESSLSKWCRQYRSDINVESMPSFVRITPLEQQARQRIIPIEVKLSNGTTLHLNVPMVDAVDLIQEISHATSIIR